MKPDPRHYQIAVLAALLAYGLTRLDFEVGGAQAAAMLTTALLTQFLCTRGLPATPALEAAEVDSAPEGLAPRLTYASSVSGPHGSAA